MSHSFDAVFDGHVLLPSVPLNLPPNTRLRVTIDSFPAEDKPKLGEPYSSLKFARQAKLPGPADWSENINRYVNEEDAPSGS